LYRVHRFDKDPRLFVLDGAVSATCDLDPTVFRARVK
jgi:hypothetical protein